MCVKFLSKFERQLKEKEVGSNVDKIEIELMKACKSAKGKDERFVSALYASLLLWYKYEVYSSWRSHYFTPLHS